MRDLVRRLTAWALTLRIVRAFLHYSEHAGPQLADAITYRALFGVFAAVLLGFTAVAAWLGSDAHAQEALTAGVDAAVPGLIGHGGVIDLSVVTAPSTLSVAGAVSLVGLVGAAVGAVATTRWALRTMADHTGEDPAWIWLTLRDLGLAAAVGLAVAASSAVAFFGTRVIDRARGGARGTDVLAALAARALPVLVVFVLDVVVVALLFVTLAGVRASRRNVLAGALLGAVGLTVLQELSGLFVRGASANPLMASFASLVALLLWMNLSAQVILVAGAYIIVAAQEENDRVRARYGARTLAERRVQQAENALREAAAELDRARLAVDAERGGRSA